MLYLCPIKLSETGLYYDQTLVQINKNLTFCVQFGQIFIFPPGLFYKALMIIYSATDLEY